MKSELDSSSSCLTNTFKTITKIYGYAPKFDFDTTKPTMIPKRLVDVSSIKNDLGWSPNYNFELCINQTIDYYLNKIHFD